MHDPAHVTIRTYALHVKTMPLEHLSICLAICTVSWAQVLVVSQPDTAEGTEGNSIILCCSYNSSSEPKIGSYRWQKDREQEITNNTPQFRGRLVRTSHEDFISKRKADIEIWDLRHYDAGMYRCLVSMHDLPEISGNETKLQVTKPNATNSAGDDAVSTTGVLMGFGAGLGSALLIFVIAAPLIFICYKKKQAKSRDHQAKDTRTRLSKQDRSAEADLNYAELSVKKGKKLRLQTEVVTYAAVKRHEQY